MASNQREGNKHGPMIAEAELVEKLKERDTHAFERLMSQHGSMMYRVASKMVGAQEAEEVIQDTLLALYQKIHTFDGQSALGTWIYRIVVNNSLMRLRSRSRSPEELMDPAEPEFTETGEFANKITAWGMPPEDLVIRQEVLTLLNRGIDRLSESYRVVYVLAEIECLSQQEIASILKLTVGSVKTRLHRARLFLRETLEDYFSEKRKRPLDG